MPTTKKKPTPPRPVRGRKPTGADPLDGKLVRDAIEATELTPLQFARFIVREHRHVKRYLAGETALPTVVRKRILEILATHPDDRRDEVERFIIRCQRSAHLTWKHTIAKAAS